LCLYLENLTLVYSGKKRVLIFLTEKEDCFWCVAEIAGTVAGCIAGGWTGVGIVGCVAAAIGTGDISRPNNFRNEFIC
jgi:hypothetical protein